MDPDEIKLEKLSKEFEYQKISNELDSCDNISYIRDIAKSYAKLYLKQQELVTSWGLNS